MYNFLCQNDMIFRKDLNYNHGKNISEKLCEITQYGKTLVSIFQQFSASIKKIEFRGKNAQ